MGDVKEKEGGKGMRGKKNQRGNDRIAGLIGSASSLRRAGDIRYLSEDARRGGLPPLFIDPSGCTSGPEKIDNGDNVDHDEENIHG
jgi:hypothetical protein